MNAHKNAVPCYAVNKSRHILSLSLIALLGAGAGALGTGPAFAADGVHCVHTIDYNKLSANELEMLYRGIDVPQFTNEGATKGKCVATIDYSKLSANQLETIYHDIDVPQFANGGATMGKYLAAIDYTKLSVAELEKINQGIDFTLVDGVDGADKDKSMAAFVGK